MSGRFTDLEVRSPHLIAPISWDQLPLWEKAIIGKQGFVNSREWMPLDPRRFRLEPESYRTQYSIANIGRLRGHRIADSRAMQFTIRLPTTDVVRIVIFEQGGARFALPGGDEPAMAHASVGATYSDAPGFRAITSDGNSRLMLTLPGGLLRQKLGALLEGRPVDSIAFQPVFDTTRGAGATIRRMIGSLFAELEHPDTLLTNEIVIRGCEDNLVLSLLLGLPHNHTAALQQQKAAAAPRTVKRAEEFMRANAALPLTIAEIAEAAGCSVRALQGAFRRFRGTTPMAALQRARLEEARAEMLRPDQTDSLGRIAAAHGFSSPSRFARLFRSTYGVSPSQTLQGRHKAALPRRHRKAAAAD